jgi:hypothetical protein
MARPRPFDSVRMSLKDVGGVEGVPPAAPRVVSRIRSMLPNLAEPLTRDFKIWDDPPKVKINTPQQTAWRERRHESRRRSTRLTTARPSMVCSTVNSVGGSGRRIVSVPLGLIFGGRK